MSLEVERFLRAHPDVTTIEALLPDSNGVLRGKWIPRDKLEKVYQGDLKFPKSALSLDIWGRDVAELVFASGDDDGLCLPVDGTLLPVPWSPEGLQGQVMLSMVQSSGEPYLGDPRQVLQRVVERYDARGWRPVVAAELEFSLLRRDRRKPHYIDGSGRREAPIGGNLYDLDVLQQNHHMLEDIHRACLLQGLPFDGVVKESAPSQYEINMRHVDSPVLAACQVLMMKRVIKGVARKHELVASFMPKPFEGEAGNGLHVHCSVLDRDGRNIFDNGDAEGSPELHCAIAGCLEHMPDSFAIFSPSFNGYRRFQEDSHAPVGASWGIDNRTVAIRVPAGSSSARRLEHRVAGSDANPYLALAIILAAALDGIERRLSPGDPISGNSYGSDSKPLPVAMDQALELFRTSSFVSQALGAEMQKSFSATKEQELMEFRRHVSNFEYQAYIERL